MSRYIDAEPIEKFITDGLNSQEKPYGWVGVKILTEVHYAPTADVAPVIHGHWIMQKKYVEISSAEYPLRRKTKLYIPDFYNCSVCGRREPYTEPYCHCGAKMDESEEKINGNSANANVANPGSDQQKD